MKGNTIILTHSGADLDAISSMYAASKLYQGSIIIHPGSLDINAAKLVTIFGESLTMSKVKEIPNKFKNEIKRAIVVDTKNFNRIGEGKQFLKKEGMEIIVFDHHTGDSDLPNAKVVFRQFGANTTIITQLLMKKKIILNPFEATLIALGIFEDTGSFSFPSVKTEDFAAMTFLFSFGVSMKIVHHFLSPFLGTSQVKLLKELLDHLEEYKIKGSRIAVATARINTYIPGISLIAHKMMELIDSDAAFILVTLGKDTFLIGRSSSMLFDVKKIIDAFGGGGHPTAASVFIKNKNVEHIKDKLITELHLSDFPVLRAKHIMSSPVKSVSPETNIKDALKILVRMGYSGLPLEENGEITGMISKRDIEKILLFERRNRPVKQYASPFIVKINYDSDLREIEDAMIINDVGRVLVERNGRIVGIISRSDLLKAYRIKEELQEQPSVSSSFFLPERNEIIHFLRETLPKEIFKLLKNFGEISKNSKQKIYLVGGAVRDMFLKEKSLDMDFVLSDDAVIFGRKLNEYLSGDIKIYPETQTVNFKLNNLNFDFTTARREYYDEKSLIPIIEKASLKEDLKRRDFTINTLAIDITDENFGRIFDFYGGYSDLRKKIIRVLHSLSFIEDPSRILRAIKYMIKFNFVLSVDTENLLKKAVELGSLRAKHSQRIMDELIELLSGDFAKKAVLEMERQGILKDIFKLKRLSAAKKTRLDKAENLLRVYKIKENRSLIFISIIMDGKNISEIKNILRFFSFRGRIVNEIIKSYSIMDKFHKKFTKLSEPELYFMLKSAGEFYILAYLTKAKGEEELIITRFMNKVRYIKLEISGKDLKEFGLKEGPQYGHIFKELLKLKIAGKISSRSDEINYLIRNKEKYILNERNTG
jgi:tRNA nucleotidyltransferase (CCA-adding enzyme)